MAHWHPAQRGACQQAAWMVLLYRLRGMFSLGSTDIPVLCNWPTGHRHMINTCVLRNSFPTPSLPILESKNR